MPPRCWSQGGLTPISGGGHFFKFHFSTFLILLSKSGVPPPQMLVRPTFDPHLGDPCCPLPDRRIPKFRDTKKIPQKSGNWDFNLVKTAKMGQNLKPKILKIGHFRGLLTITKKGIFEKNSPARVCSPGAPPLRSGQT